MSSASHATVRHPVVRLGGLRRRLALANLAAILTLGYGLAAVAVVSTQIAIAAAVRIVGNTPVADGTYQLTFRLYGAKTGGRAAWPEGPVAVSVTSGALSYALGTTKPLTSKLLAGLKSAWLSVQVGTDPALPRHAASTAAYALVAGQVSCSGCISGAELAKGGITAATVAFAYAGSKTKGGKPHRLLPGLQENRQARAL